MEVSVWLIMLIALSLINTLGLCIHWIRSFILKSVNQIMRSYLKEIRQKTAEFDLVVIAMAFVDLSNRMIHDLYIS